MQQLAVWVGLRKMTKSGHHQLHPLLPPLLQPTLELLRIQVVLWQRVAETRKTWQGKATEEKEHMMIGTEKKSPYLAKISSTIHLEWQGRGNVMWYTQPSEATVGITGYLTHPQLLQGHTGEEWITRSMRKFLTLGALVIMLRNPCTVDQAIMNATTGEDHLWAGERQVVPVLFPKQGLQSLTLFPMPCSRKLEHGCDNYNGKGTWGQNRQPLVLSHRGKQRR